MSAPPDSRDATLIEYRRPPPLTDTAVEAVRLQCAAHATDRDDLDRLLVVLGLRGAPGAEAT
jgi:hypothetical protein